LDPINIILSVPTIMDFTRAFLVKSFEF